MTARTRTLAARRLGELGRRLSERDRRVLDGIRRHRFLTTGQVERLYFTEHASPLASARACRRVLRRLDDWDLIATLPRRIGGLLAGSATATWHVAPAGNRILSFLAGDGLTSRIREPSVRFIDHTLAVAEAHVRLTETARTGRFELLDVQIEQEGWRNYLTGAGTTDQLKPDLTVITAPTDYEDHWFLEVDLGTEHLPTIQHKCQQYQRYHQTGTEQAQHGIFPVVLWIAPNPIRAQKLHEAITSARSLDQTLFRITDMDQLGGTVAEASA